MRESPLRELGAATFADRANGGSLWQRQVGQMGRIPDRNPEDNLYPLYMGSF